MPATFPFVRHDAQIAVALEDSHGTEQTDSAKYRSMGKIEDAGDMPDPEVDWQENRTIGNRDRQLSGKEAGQNTYEGGSLTVIPTDAFPIEFLLGNEATGGGRIDVSSDPLPLTATVEATYYGAGGDDDFVRTFVGNAPETGTISVDNESRLSVDIDFQAQGVTTGTATVKDVSPPSNNPWLFSDAASDLTIRGTDYARVTDFEWELTNNLDPRYYIQSTNPEDPYEIHYGNADHAVTVDVTPTDDALYQELLGRDSAGNATIAFERPDGARLDFNFEEIGLESAPIPMTDEGAPDQTVSLVPNVGYVNYTSP